jgi:hypothetical protein
VFYVKGMSSKPKKRKNNISNNEPKRHIVLSGKNIMGIEDRCDMSEDYKKNNGILPFIVNNNPSVLPNDEDTLVTA